MKLLIIDDDPKSSCAIRSVVEDAGYFAEISRDGERALRLAATAGFSAIILEAALPTIDGLALCRRLRKHALSTPILMLSSRGSILDRVRGLEAGADDYMAKPFDSGELVARVRALLRRDKKVKSGRFEIRDLEIDSITHRVWRNGVEITLTRREYSLLEALALNEGQVLSREQILANVWMCEDVYSNTVDVYIRNLRRKLDPDRETRLIHSVYGYGYVLRR